MRQLAPSTIPLSPQGVSEPEFFSCSDKFTRFCQWKNVELNIHVSVRGGPGEPCCPLRPPGARPGGGPPFNPRGAAGDSPRQGSMWRGWAWARGLGWPRRPTATPSLPSPQLTMNDFSVHRIIGRGGFGEVYGCRKADTGKM